MTLLVALALSLSATDLHSQRVAFVERLSKVNHGFTRKEVVKFLGAPTTNEVDDRDEYLLYGTSETYPDLGSVWLRDGRVEGVIGKGEVHPMPLYGQRYLEDFWRYSAQLGKSARIRPLMKTLEEFSRLPRNESGAILREFTRTEPKFEDQTGGARLYLAADPYRPAGRLRLISLLLQPPMTTIEGARLNFRSGLAGGYRASMALLNIGRCG